MDRSSVPQMDHFWVLSEGLQMHLSGAGASCPCWQMCTTFPERLHGNFLPQSWGCGRALGLCRGNWRRWGWCRGGEAAWGTRARCSTGTLIQALQPWQRLCVPPYRQSSLGCAGSPSKTPPLEPWLFMNVLDKGRIFLHTEHYLH